MFKVILQENSNCVTHKSWFQILFFSDWSFLKAHGVLVVNSQAQRATSVSCSMYLKVFKQFLRLLETFGAVFFLIHSMHPMAFMAKW